MSIRVMTRVWDESDQEGTKLLMLLAIADFANDDGDAWPSIERLAQKTRVKVRQAKNLIQQLEADGEIAIRRGAGRGQTSIYHVNTGAEKVQSSVTFAQNAAEKKVQSSVKKVQSSVIKGAIAIAPDPLEPPIEPSDNNNRQNAPLSPSPLPPAEVVALPAPQPPQPPQPPEPPAAPADAISPADWARVRAVYEGNFGMFTSLLVERVKEALRQHPAETVIMAMDRAVSAERRRWDYVEGILRNWAAEGYGTGTAGAKGATVGNANRSRAASQPGRTPGGSAGGAGERRQEAPAAPAGLREWLLSTGQIQPAAAD